MHPLSAALSAALSTAERDIFLADTLSAAWELALESQAYFDDDSTNHTTTTASTTATTVVATPTTSGRRYIHNSTDLDHRGDTGDIMPKQ